MVLSRRSAWLLAGFGIWSWVIWPTFLRNVWHDPRSWHDGATAFFTVHLLLSVVSLAFGTVIGALGVRGLLRARLAAPPPQRPTA